mmetsp:Transcript_4705/g.6464  ORF Transcript_4705/g.6464 Transcript_4705/m.6464 type:complete len:241 (-) Transcript_4705:122-844(-)
MPLFRCYSITLLFLIYGFTNVASFQSSNQFTSSSKCHFKLQRSKTLFEMVAGSDSGKRMIPLFSILAAGSVAFTPFAGADGPGILIDSKIEKGAASTSVNNSGSIKTITRGVDLSGANFEKKNLKGVSFQQSIIRGGNFRGANVEAASFFDADLSGADFTGAYMNLVNIELADLDKAVLDNAIITEAYVTGATTMLPKSIVGADFSETYFRKDQKKYLCDIASGTNPTTGVDTRDSLLCD